jgi:AhpD family alkylhydroperoxidase
MLSTLAARPGRRTLAQIRHVRPVPPRSARGLVARVYAQAEREFGLLAPPLALHSPAPGLLAACWLMLRETLLADGQAGRAARESVAEAVSTANSCPYCVAVHGAVRRAALHRQPTSEADAARLLSISAWANRGPGAAAAMEPPFPLAQLPELAGVAVTFHYLNRMVTIFLPDSPMPAAAPAAMMGLLGRLLLSAARHGVPAGAALDLLPPGALPAGLEWAAGSPSIAAAFGRAAAAIERAGQCAVPPAVRELAAAELARWDASPRGPGRAWAESAVAALPAADRPAGRLVLLTAFAPYQIVPSDLSGYRVSRPGDESLLGLTAWASFAAACAAARRLVPTGSPDRQPVALSATGYPRPGRPGRPRLWRGGGHAR